jgi:hypothetical protein
VYDMPNGENICLKGSTLIIVKILGPQKLHKSMFKINKVWKQN